MYCLYVYCLFQRRPAASVLWVSVCLWQIVDMVIGIHGAASSSVVPRTTMTVALRVIKPSETPLSLLADDWRVKQPRDSVIAFNPLWRTIPLMRPRDNLSNYTNSEKQSHVVNHNKRTYRVLHNALCAVSIPFDTATVLSYNMVLIITSTKPIKPNYFSNHCLCSSWFCYLLVLLP